MFCNDFLYLSLYKIQILYLLHYKNSIVIIGFTKCLRYVKDIFEDTEKTSLTVQLEVLESLNVPRNLSVC